MTDVTTIEIINQGLEIIALIALYIITGFGPGFLLGVVIMSRLAGKDNPYLSDVHEQAKQRAAEHNKQWHPNDPRWQK